jgi:hypothetical protein
LSVEMETTIEIALYIQKNSQETWSQADNTVLYQTNHFFPF